MATLDITRTYNDTALLSEADLDHIKTETETFLNTTKLNGDNIQDNGIDASDKFLVTSVTTAKFPSNNFTTAKFADAPDGLSTPKINDLAISTSKILDNNVTTTDINTSAVTYAKLSSANAVFSSSSGLFTLTTTDVATDVPNLSVTINTSTGFRPVLINLTQLDATSMVLVEQVPANLGFVFASVSILRNGQVISSSFLNVTYFLDIDSSCNAVPFVVIDSPNPGINTYTVQVVLTGSTGATLYFYNHQLTAIEL